MIRLAVPLVVQMAMPFAASPAPANTVDCGGNSFSYGEVAAGGRGGSHRGPIEVMPDSLCADLIEIRRQEIDSLNLTIERRANPEPSPGRPAPAAPR
jgi:hypothetical protein